MTEGQRRRTWGLAAALALGTVTAGAAAAQEALGRGDTRGALTTSDGMMGDGSYRDCRVLTVTPGSVVTVTLSATAFDPYLIAAVGADCATSDASWYGNDDARPGSRDALLRFRAIAENYVVIANSAGAGETGPYVLNTYIAAPGDVAAASGLSRSLPEIVVNNLYASDHPFDLDDPASLRRWFTPNVAGALTLLQQRSGGEGLGFDFLVDGQDSDLTDFVFSLHAGERPDRPVVRAAFRNFGEPVRMDFVLAPGETGWLIADVRAIRPDGHQKWTLNHRLSQALNRLPRR